MTAPDPAASADGDFAAVLPAARAAVTAGRSIVIGWLSRGDGAPLELITTVGPGGPGGTGDPGPAADPAPATGVPQATGAPQATGVAQAGGVAQAASPGAGALQAADLPPPAGACWPAGISPATARGKHAAAPRITVAPDPAPLLFPPGAWGLPVARGCAGDLDRLVWISCPAVRDQNPQRPEPVAGPTLFETALTALMRRPFGWLVVAEPTDLLAAETAGLRTELDILRRHRDGQADAVERAERRLAERGDFGDGGLWSVRVLAGAPGPDELDVLAPLLAGSAELGPHPYRLCSGTGGAQRLNEALSASRHDPGDGAQSPFFVTAGTIAALAGLPRHGVPGLNVTRPADPGARESGGAGRLADVSPDRLAEASVELAPEPGPGPGRLRVPLAALGHGVLVTGSAGAGPSRTVRNILTQLTALGLPWLVVDPAGAGYETITGRDGSPVTVINPCDPDAVPLTVSPLAPEPGYPLQAHMALVRRLLDVAFGADELFSLAVSLALPRVYEAAGWDLLTGRAAGRALAAPAVPGLGQLHAAVIDVIRKAGYDRKTRARLRGVADARFGSLRTGSAGRFLEGGHPGDLGALVRRPVVLAVHDIGAAGDRAFVSGALLIRLAEYLRLRSRPPASEDRCPAAHPAPGPQPAGPGGPLRHVLVIEEARAILRDRGEGRPATQAAEWLAALLAEFGAYGEGTVLTEPHPALLVPDASRNVAARIVHRTPAAHCEHAGEQGGRLPLLTPEVAVLLAGDAGPPRWGRIPVPGAIPPPGATRPSDSGDVTSLLSGRRSVACGRQCRDERPCRLAELREAELLATAPEYAWLRVWAEAFLLAFLTDNLLPAVPAPLRRRWRGLGARSRECLLARVVDHQVGVRAAALRPSYDPARFSQVVASAAAIRLDRAGGGVPSATRPGPAWVVPQLRWLHEIERLCPLSGLALAPGDHAPPLDFDLTALPDWPGIRVGQRIRALRRHPLSMELAANRRLAWTALAGEDGPGPFATDLAQVMPGVDHAQALRHTAALMQVSGGVSAGPGWLEAVLSWPRRFVTFSGGQCLPGDAADCPAG